MKSAVIVFPGSNCDRDVKVALEASTGKAPAMVWHGDAEVPAVDLIVVPGGFSYGDYLRCGAMAAHSPAMREVTRRARDGVPVLGICNGFQILAEAGLLPGVLMRNAGLRFVCHDVTLRVEPGESIFTSGYFPGQVITVPIAHNEGNYFADSETLRRIEDNAQIAFRYCDDAGTATDQSNPNGSVANIAGVMSESRTVLGMMPHPERAADPLLGGSDGKAMFDGMTAALAA